MSRAGKNGKGRERPPSKCPRVQKARQIKLVRNPAGRMGAAKSGNAAGRR